MRRGFVKTWWGRRIIALYALAMFTAGFAHHTVTLAKPNIDLSAYALPDGTIPVLCETGGENGGSGHDAQQSCPACILRSAPGLVEPEVCIDAPATIVIAVAQFQTALAVRTPAIPREVQPRGPPLT